MEFSFSSVFAGFFFGVFGVYLIRQGRKDANLLHIALGVVLLIYPYFVTGAILTWVLGIGILALAYYYRRY
jgi:hypothetical protein